MGRLTWHESKYVWSHSTAIFITKTFPSKYLSCDFSALTDGGFLDFAQGLHEMQERAHFSGNI